MIEEGSPSWSSVRKGSSAPRFEPLTSRKKPGLAHRTSRARTVLEAIFHPMGPVATAMDLTNTPDLFDCSSWKHHAAIRYIARFLIAAKHDRAYPTLVVGSAARYFASELEDDTVCLR
jgi:hypothetical protein